jgi:hypothetical protein
MALPTKAAGEIVTAAEYNAIIAAINRCPPMLEVTITSIDGNGSLVLPTGEETDVNLDGAGVESATVNGCSVPDLAPWPLRVVNVSGTSITLVHEAGAEPTPAKRFQLPNDTNLVLLQGDGVIFSYRSVPQGARWCALTKG